MKALVIAAVFLPLVGHACLQVEGNESERGRAENGRVMVSGLRLAMQTDLSHRQASTHFGEGKTKEQIRQVEAIDLIYRGDIQKALAILLQVESESPGRYDTAFNLGTAYELAGDNVNALKWIYKGLGRNHRALGGTEWLHIAILEAKIESAKNPDHPLKKHILELPEKLTQRSVIMIAGKSYWSISVSEALYHQLHERMEFVKPRDPYVADLLYSYALLEGGLGTDGNPLAVDNARGLLSMAREYGFADEALLTQHEHKYWVMAVKAQVLHWAQWIPYILLVILLPFWLVQKCRQEESWLFWAWRRFKTNKEARMQVKLGGD